MACLVGIDYGTKRTGLACTDPNQLIASGLKNLPTSEVIPFLKAYCDQEKVAGFVVGKPLQKDGTPAPVETQISAFVTSLERHFPDCEINRYDERFTSKMALQAMIDGGLKKKQRADKGMVDQVSATLILQSFLNYRMNTL